MNIEVFGLKFVNGPNSHLKAYEKYLVDLHSSVFNGGEEHIRLDTTHLHEYDRINVRAHIKSSSDFMKLVFIKSVLDAHDIKNVELYLPYIPYGRQDRVCNEGEAFSLKVFGKMLNNLKFYKIHTLDPHSSVSEACVDNLVVYNQYQIFSGSSLLKDYLSDNSVIVAPDAGAMKKVGFLAKMFDVKDIVRADKVRNLDDGKILETVVHAKPHSLDGKNVVIFDDICDGGRTFIELAHAIKDQHTLQSINLVVTHGIFSAGLDALDKNFDFVFCANYPWLRLEDFRECLIYVDYHPYGF